MYIFKQPLIGGEVACHQDATFLYTDPVTVNGRSLTAADLVDRARAMQGVFEAPERRVLDVVEGEVADGVCKVALAFRLGGRQVGTLNTAAGPLPPTGERLELRVIDVLTLTGGRISEIWMVADELGALAAVGAVRLPVGS